MKLCNVILLIILFSGTITAQWELKTVSPVNQLNWVHFLDSSKGFIVGNNGSVYKTTDGGGSWSYSVVDPLNTVDLFCVTFSNDSLGWISGRYGSIFSTTNGGVTWKTESTFSEIFGGYYLTQIQFINKANGWLVGSSPYIYNTSSSGKGWCVTPSGFNSIFQKIQMVNAQIGYANGSSGSAAKTVDGGTTWQPLQTGITETFNSIFFNNASAGFMIGTEGAIIKTTNGGEVWNKYPNSPKEYLSAIRFATDSIGWIVGANGSIYKTTNAGSVWSKESSRTTKGFIGLSAVDKNHAWAVGEQGMVMRYGPSSVNPDIVTLGKQDFNFELSQSYPNPFNPSTTIDFTLPVNDVVELKVFDILGKEIRTVIHQSFTAGTHSVHFDSQGISSGTYLYRLTAGKYSASQKMILAK